MLHRMINRLLALSLAFALMLGVCPAWAQGAFSSPDKVPVDILLMESHAVATASPMPTPRPTITPKPATPAPETPEPTAAPAEEQDQPVVAQPMESGDWTNILLLGCDSYGANSYDRTDSMIILSVNLTTNELKMTSLMRDTWIKVPGSSRHRKLTELCTVGGPQMTIQAINDNFGMNIEKYALISMAGIAEVIDLLGGLDLDITEAERKALNKGLFDLSGLSGMEQLEESGEGVHLNGNQATAYARIRKIDSDYVRTERQRTVLLAMAQKLKDGASAGTILAIVSTLLDYVETNLSFAELMLLANAGLKMDLSAAQQLRIPADGTFDSGTFDGIWCIKPNFEKNAKLLNEFIYGAE